MKLVLAQPTLFYEAGDRNVTAVRALLAPLAGSLAADDVVVLPEHFDLRESRAAYETTIGELSRSLGCHVVGGSHHEQKNEGAVNAGVVTDPSGAVVCRYEKLRPYAEERARVHAGQRLGELRVGSLSVLVLVCADFWFSDLFYRATRAPDLILVPSFSVTRKPTPDYSRALWQHLAVARAYEFGAYVGVSDWAHAPSPFGPSPSGVSGLADPTRVAPSELFRPVAGALGVYDLDPEALAAFQKDRASRGFFWKAVERDGAR